MYIVELARTTRGYTKVRYQYEDHLGPVVCYCRLTSTAEQMVEILNTASPDTDIGVRIKADAPVEADEAVPA